jgi:uncharacterized RDD family membrane protein YckC
MNCPRCGEICCCSQETAAVVLREKSALGDTSTPAHDLEQDHGTFTTADLAGVSATETAIRDQDDLAWREEVAASLNRYRARRKPLPPRYPSLRLQFEKPGNGADDKPGTSHYFEAISDQALALDLLGKIQQGDVCRKQFTSAPKAASETPSPLSQNPNDVLPDAKIIEFPRMRGTAPPTPLDELAEPVSQRPRILEALEVAPPPPALGGITMEDALPRETEKRPGIDFPLQSAPLARRVVAAAMDWLIVMVASLLFGATFWKIVAVSPPMVQMLGLAAGVPALFWAAYQYLLIVYSGSTPGLRLAGLELTGFDGSPANRKLRRWRVLASYLSATSLGMGYAWMLLDEDQLCWHDRITHTYLAPKQR